MSDPAVQRGWAAAERSFSPPEPLGYGGHRLSSAAAPFSPSHGGYGIDPGAIRRGVQVREGRLLLEGFCIQSGCWREWALRNGLR